MKTFVEILLYLVLWPIIRLWELIRSLGVHFVYKKDQIFFYNCGDDLTLYRVSHVHLFGSPSFKYIHFDTSTNEEISCFDEKHVPYEIHYGWNRKFKQSYYQIHSKLQQFPYSEYEAIEKKILETENQIKSILKNAVIQGNHPSEYLPGMILVDRDNCIFHIQEQEKDGYWKTCEYILYEKLPLTEMNFLCSFDDEDIQEYIVISETDLEQIITIAKKSHEILRKELEVIKDRYKVNVQPNKLDIHIATPGRVYFF